jgi:hypothetical protein
MTMAAKGLLGADDLEVLVDEDMVRPVDADVVDFVVAGTALEKPGRRPKDWPALAEPQRQLSLPGIDRGDGMSRGRSWLPSA